jgi:hypothetical protein
MCSSFSNTQDTQITEFLNMYQLTLQITLERPPKHGSTMAMHLTHSLPESTKVDFVKPHKIASVSLSQCKCPWVQPVQMCNIHTAEAQRIFVQQQILIFYMQGHFLFMGEYFLHGKFLYI